MVSFSVVAYFQGKKAKVGTGTSPCMTIPAEHRTLNGTFQAPGWLQLRVNGGAPFFAYARRPPSRASVDVTLPQYCAPGIERGTVLHVVAESAEPYAARARGGAFDWLSHVQHESYLPVDGADGVLSIWNQHEPPFELLRSPAVLPTYRMLGLWQAEGTKADTAPDFTFANSSVELLAYSITLLDQWGLSKNRLSLEILRAWNETIEHARAKYAPLGIEIVGERVRQRGRGENAGIIHVRSSAPLLRIVRAATAQIFASPFPSAEAAREYALGWLDGDGTITIQKALPGRRGELIELRLAGYEQEQTVVLRALHAGFGWRAKGGAFSGVRSHRARNLAVREAAELAVAGGFRFSLSRARLLYAIERRCLHGVPTTDPAEMLAAKELLQRLQPEIETLRRVAPPERLPVGVKGVPYPLISLPTPRSS